MATGSRIQRMQQGVRTGECQRRSALEAAYRDALARVSGETVLRGHDLAFPGECHLPIEIEPGRLRQARADLAKHAHDPSPRGELYAGDLRASESACKRKFAADLEGEGPRNAVAHLGQRIEGRDDEKLRLWSGNVIGHVDAMLVQPKLTNAAVVAGVAFPQ